MNYFQGRVDLRDVWVVPGLAVGRWMALEGCPPWTHPHLLSEPTSARCEIELSDFGGLGGRRVELAPGLAVPRWFALAGCRMTHPLFF